MGEQEAHEIYMKEFGRQIYELGIVKQELENKKMELEISNSKLWLKHSEERNKLDLDVLKAQKEYFEMAKDNKLNIIMGKI